ncbi:hypothetical protein ACMD2_22135 [Ananas comosus]|uniref:MLLE-like domain-containing protein n=1 Tax=Ananas comosus TaxID=4615 RepID=A0A199UIX8_ANACO|nr:hypothetical protein ACMD2_22135 [Ananas comosus]
MAEKSTAENNIARVVAELLALSFNNNQIIKAANIFAVEPSKMNVLFSLPQQLKMQYVLDVREDECTFVVSCLIFHIN